MVDVVVDDGAGLWWWVCVWMWCVGVVVLVSSTVWGEWWWLCVWWWLVWL